MKWDAAVFLTDEDMRNLYLQLYAEEDPDLYDIALEDVKRSRFLHENKLIEA